MNGARTALVTGAAGFIGFHLCRRLLADGFRVIGLDAMTPYYDVTLKRRRNQILLQTPGYDFHERAVEEAEFLSGLMAEARPDIVVHLAAQAGVRHSLQAPREFFQANLAGTFELLEAARAAPPAHLLLASTSSVYGAAEEMPFRETMCADTQMSFYAATKKATESMAHAYAHLHGLPVTMFRFFTVYGPWGRPDMALFRFTRAILEGTPIEVYNHGRMRRDFTYVDDLVAGIRGLIDAAPPPPGAGREAVPGDSLSPVAPWRLVNVGTGAPVELMAFIAAVEDATGRTAEKRFLDMQPGDVPGTWADVSLLTALTGGPPPHTPLAEGVGRFVAWYRDYYAA